MPHNNSSKKQTVLNTVGVYVRRFTRQCQLRTCTALTALTPTMDTVDGRQTWLPHAAAASAGQLHEYTGLASSGKTRCGPAANAGDSLVGLLYRYWCERRPPRRLCHWRSKCFFHLLSRRDYNNAIRDTMCIPVTYAVWLQASNEPSELSQSHNGYKHSHVCYDDCAAVLIGRNTSLARPSARPSVRPSVSRSVFLPLRPVYRLLSRKQKRHRKKQKRSQSSSCRSVNFLFKRSKPWGQG